MGEAGERELVDDVQRRLAAKFAGIPVTQVAAAVEEALSRFEGCTVRDYIPLLVERRACTQLTRLAARV